MKYTYVRIQKINETLDQAQRALEAYPIRRYDKMYDLVDQAEEMLERLDRSRFRNLALIKLSGIERSFEKRKTDLYEFANRN